MGFNSGLKVLNTYRFLVQVFVLTARKINKIIDVGCYVLMLRLDRAYIPFFHKFIRYLLLLGFYFSFYNNLSHNC
jgi:hypothetical protein